MRKRYLIKREENGWFKVYYKEFLDFFWIEVVSEKGIRHEFGSKESAEQFVKKEKPVVPKDFWKLVCSFVRPRS